MDITESEIKLGLQLCEYYDHRKGDPADRIEQALRDAGVTKARAGNSYTLLQAYAGYKAAMHIDMPEVADDTARREVIEAIKNINEQIRNGEQWEEAIDGLQLKLSQMETVETIEEATPTNKRDYGNCEGYPIDFLDDLNIPATGCTLFGAKTGQGKTTALINVMRNLIKLNKSVCFIT